MRLFRDIVLAIASMVAFLTLVECSLRFAGVKYDASLYRLDRDLGYVLRPNAEGWSVKEHAQYERINSQGLRDREHSLKRPAGVIRIAIVGDSYSEAKEIEQDAAYWSVMERTLNHRLQGDAPRVEVINFGVAGYALSQDYLVIKDRIWRYDPQIVILTGTLHSLVLDSSRHFGTLASEGSVPYFVFRDHGIALDDISAAQRRAFKPPSRFEAEVATVTNDTRLLSLLNATRRQLALDLVALRSKLHSSAKSAGSTDDDPDYETLVLRGPVTPELADAWRVAEELIRLSRDETAKHGAEFWFFLFDMPPQVDPDPQSRAATRAALGGELFHADRLFDEFANREHILHEMLAPKMLEFSSAHGVVLHGFPNRRRNSGHWNEAGHSVVGDLIAEELLRCSKVLHAAAVSPAEYAAQNCASEPFASQEGSD
jgi:hypothetical protein